MAACHQTFKKKKKKNINIIIMLFRLANQLRCNNPVTTKRWTLLSFSGSCLMKTEDCKNAERGLMPLSWRFPFKSETKLPTRHLYGLIDPVFNPPSVSVDRNYKNVSLNLKTFGILTEGLKIRQKMVLYIFFAIFSCIVEATDDLYFAHKGTAR